MAAQGGASALSSPSKGSSSSSNSRGTGTGEETTAPPPPGGGPVRFARPPCRWDARKTVTDRAEKEPLAPSGPSLEDAVDALEDGDRTVRTGTAMAALRHTTFRRVFIGAFLSNIGSWMQNVVLGALVYDLTGSATLVGVIVLAQLGPLLFFSLVGGLLADVFDRRRLLIVVSILQGLLSLVLALVARGDDPSIAALIAVTFLIGMGQAVFGPVYAALLPGLVGRDDLSGAVSLNSAQMNGSRVIGPVIGSLLFARYGAATVFVVNAATYLFVVGALLTVTLPAVVADKTQQGWRRLVAGFEIARRDYVVGRCLLIIFLFSLLSLTFVGQLPVLAEENLGIDPRSTQYGLLYTCFGLGAMTGALSIGTVFAGRSMAKIVRGGLIAFAASLAVFALLRSPGAAYPTILVLGFFYFSVVTSLATALQERLDESTRGGSWRCGSWPSGARCRSAISSPARSSTPRPSPR